MRTVMLENQTQAIVAGGDDGVASLHKVQHSPAPLARLIRAVAHDLHLARMPAPLRHQALRCRSAPNVPPPHHAVHAATGQ